MINKNLENELDEQFPKGDKARGRALVLFAIAQMEIKKAQDEILDELINRCNDRVSYIKGQKKIGKMNTLWNADEYELDKLVNELRKRKEKTE